MNIRDRIQELRENRENGFTLIELLLVIIILGVLAGIVVFSVANISDRGVQAACKSDVKSVEVAQEARFASAKKAYAASVAVLVSDGYLKSAPSTTSGYTITTDATGAVAVSPACSTL